MERVIYPVERLKHSSSNISCKIFEKGNTSEKIYWFSGLSDDKIGLLNCLKAKHGESKIVMISQNMHMMGRAFFNSLNLYQSEFLNCDFSDLMLKKTKFFNCTFVNCSFNKTVFEDCTLFKCSFKFCNMSGTKFLRGFLDVKDDTGSNFVHSEFENKSSEQRKKIEDTRKTLQQISSNDTSQADSLASTLHSTRINCPVANVDSEITDWKMDISDMLTLTLSRIRYMDPLTIIENMKNEEYMPPQLEEIEDTLTSFNTDSIEIMGRNEDQSLSLIEENDMERLHDFLKQTVININSTRHFVHDFFQNPEYNLLFHAIENGSEEMCYILLEYGIDPAFQNNCGMTALQLAAGKGFENLGKLLIEYRATTDGMKTRINSVNENGVSALHTAVKGRQNNFIKMLLNYPFINVDLQEKRDKNTPLHIACFNGSNEIIDLLLKANANTEIYNKKKKLPIDLCKTEDTKKRIRDYIQSESKESFLAWGENEEKASDFIKENNMTKLRSILKTSKLDIHAVRKLHSDETLLNKAIEHRNYKAVEILIEAGADPDFLSDGHSSTPLLVAASEPSAADGRSIEDIALLLLKSGDKEARMKRATQTDRIQKTPLHGSCKTGKVNLTKELLDLPSTDVNLAMDTPGYERDVSGWTPVHFACLAGYKEIIQLLQDKADFYKKGFDEEYGVVSPMDLLDRFHPDLAFFFTKEDKGDEFEMLSKGSDKFEEVGDENGKPQKTFRSFLKFDAELVRPMVTKCYNKRHYRPEDLAQQLGDENIITLDMFDKVKKKAEDVSSNAIYPTKFVDWLEDLIEHHNMSIDAKGLNSKSSLKSSEDNGSYPMATTRQESTTHCEKQAFDCIKNKNIDGLQRIAQSININCSQCEETLLCKAVKHDFHEGVSLLLKNGADPTLKAKSSGKTALHCAAAHNVISDITKQLIEHNAYSNEIGPRINCKDHIGWTPLHVACENNNVDFVNKLLQYEETFKSPEADNPEGWTPLHEASAKNYGDIVRALVAAGADKNAVAKFKKNDIGYGVEDATPRDVAIKNRNTALLHLL